MVLDDTALCCVGSPTVAATEGNIHETHSNRTCFCYSNGCFTVSLTFAFLFLFIRAGQEPCLGADGRSGHLRLLVPIHRHHHQRRTQSKSVVSLTRRLFLRR